jgi:molybdenum cofactor biosynthesis protein B
MSDGKKGHEHRHEHGHSHGHEHAHAHNHEPGAGVPAEHKARAPRYAKVYVVTSSDSRTEATDQGGQWIRTRLADLGHVLSGAAVIPDEPSRLLAELDKARAAGAQAVLITGGTGVSRRDRTFEAVSSAIARPLPGFGELFRALSYGEVGSAAMLSRAVAGVATDGLILFAMPGSPQAVRVACDRLIFPELTHLIEELGR